MIKEFVVISRKIKKIIKKYPSPGGDGAEVIYALRNSDNLSRRIADEFVKSGQNVRKYYQRRLPSDSSKDYYYMLRNTPNNETVIVEYGFADSLADASQLKNNWQDLAEAVVKALAGYVGVSYTPPREDTGSIIPMPGNTYIVKKGDSLYAIAREFGISVEELKRANNLSNNNLSIGMVLTIPELDSDVNDIIYIVKPGDSLYKIANIYGMSVSELKDLNNLTSNLLSIGQELKVKESANIPADTYIVKSGDSLYSIAKRFNVSVDELKRVNNKTSNLLSIGEKLIIPSNTNMNYVTHVVVPGDTLYGIARKYNTTVNAVREANNLNNTMLSIGMVLKIPR